MLKIIWERFLGLPNSVQKAFVLVFVAWTAQFLTAYLYILQEDVPPQFSLMGAMLFASLIFAKKWGRIMCIFFTGWAIIWYLIFFVTFLFAKRYDISAIVAVNIALFSASVYYLWIKETAEYFTKRSEEAKAKQEKAMAEYNKKVKELEKAKNKRLTSGKKKKNK